MSELEGELGEALAAWKAGDHDDSHDDSHADSHADDHSTDDHDQHVRGAEFVLLSYREAAEFLSVEVQLVRRLAREGAIPLVILGPRTHRLRLSDLQDFVLRGGVRADDF